MKSKNYEYLKALGTVDMKTTVEISYSFMVDGKVANNQFETGVHNVSLLFDNAIADANEYARLRNGQVTIDRTETSLYINYLGVSDSNVIDRLYRVK
jgi:hypothetical protein